MSIVRLAYSKDLELEMERDRTLGLRLVFQPHEMLLPNWTS